MAYLIFTANGEEFDRRELTAPAVVGRAPDCEISVPDIMLSRHHCRLEPAGPDDDRRIVDLQSKNGTSLSGRAIAKHELDDGEELRLGRTRITFCAGAFVPPAPHVRRRGVIRPADPAEALAGTVTGLVLCEPEEVQKQSAFPYPQPRPADPHAFADENVYGMINDIVSSSWDSIMAQNSEPVRMQRVMPAAAMTQAKRGAVRPRPRVSFCLQAEHRQTDSPREQTRPATIRSSVAQPGPARRRRPWVLMTSGIVGTAAFVALWVTLILTASNPDAGAGTGPASSASSPPSSPPVGGVAIPTQTEPQPTASPAVEESHIERIEWDAVAVGV